MQKYDKKRQIFCLFMKCILQLTRFKFTTVNILASTAQSSTTAHLKNPVIQNESINFDLKFSAGTLFTKKIREYQFCQ